MPEAGQQIQDISRTLVQHHKTWAHFDTNTPVCWAPSYLRCVAFSAHKPISKIYTQNIGLNAEESKHAYDRKNVWKPPNYHNILDLWHLDVFCDTSIISLIPWSFMGWKTRCRMSGGWKIIHNYLNDTGMLDCPAGICIIEFMKISRHRTLKEAFFCWSDRFRCWWYLSGSETVFKFSGIKTIARRIRRRNYNISENIYMCKNKTQPFV